MDGAQDTLQIARDSIEALNQGDAERLTGHLAADAIWHSAATGEIIEGDQSIARNLLAYRGSFPDLHEEITNAFASGDQAAVETVVSGTYEGAVQPTVEGSGQHISLPLCYLFRVDGGKINRITTYMDYRTLMTQLDMILA